MVLQFPNSFGWIGLGAMGYPMAMQLCKHLPDTGEMHIFDINPAVLDKFSEDCANLPCKVIVEESAKHVGVNSQCIFTIVPEGSHVKDVYLSPDGLLMGNPAGKLFIDCSTIDLPTSLAVGDAVMTCDTANPTYFYDAPVSGGTAGAQKQTLTFMVGASQDDPNFPLLKELLSYMGRSIYAVGGRSLGLAAKLSNNYLSGMIALATAEAMNLGMRLGIDPKVLSRCFETSSGGSWVNSTVNPVPGVCPNAVTSKGYEGGFKVQLMRKDMALAIDAAREVGARLVLSDAGLSAYTAASHDSRCQDKDSRVVYRWLGGIEPGDAQSGCD